MRRERKLSWRRTTSARRGGWATRSCFSIKGGSSSARRSKISFQNRSRCKPLRSSKENYLGLDATAVFACCAPRRLAGARAGKVHRRRFDHFDRAVGTVRLPAAGFPEKDRDPGARG